MTGEEKSYSTADRRLDKVLTGRRWGIPIMLGLLAVIFWLTISGANLPSALLAKGLFRLQDLLSGALLGLGVPLWLHDALILGVYRVAAWVVSVMLPPMAIFFGSLFFRSSGFFRRLDTKRRTPSDKAASTLR